MNVALWCADRGIRTTDGASGRGPEGPDGPGPDGPVGHLRGIAAALARAGHVVTRVGPAPRRPWPRGLRTFGERLDNHVLAATVYGKGVPGLVWERHEPRSRAGNRWARIFGVPHLVELDAPLALERRWPGRPHPREVAREHDVLRAADRVIAVSAWLAAWAVDVAGCAPERVRHVPNGVPPQGDGDRTQVRASLGLSGPVVGFVGGRSRWQGADRLPALLDALGPGWTGLAVGSGAAGAHPRLVHAGRVDEDALPGLVAAMDVAVAPYTAQAPPWFCPLKVLAYRAQGVPVVAADLGDAAWLVGDGGIVLPADAPVGAWAEAVVAAVGRPRTPWRRTWDDVVGEVLAGHDRTLARARS